MKKCPFCSNDNPDNSEFCNSCGKVISQAPRSAALVRCPKCGNTNPYGTRYCGICRQPLTQEAADQLAREKNQPRSRKGSNGCLIAFLICLIIFILGTIFLISVSGYLSNNSNATSATGTRTTTAATTVRIPKIGERLDVGQVAYRVDKVEVSNTVGGDYINSTAKGTYLLVTLTITNNSSDPLTISDSFFTILYNGKKYSADSSATIYADSENSLWYDSINPDLTTSGVIAFDVSTEVANSADTQLQVQTGFWGTQTGIINLSR